MYQRLIVFGMALALVILCGVSESAQEKGKKKRRTGSVTGELQSRKDTKNKRNVLVEVLATGEEKARTYRVMYDPKAKGPMPKVLAAVRAAPLGARVQMDWIDTGEGLAITAFQVALPFFDSNRPNPFHLVQIISNGPRLLPTASTPPEQKAGYSHRYLHENFLRVASTHGGRARGPAPGSQDNTGGYQCAHSENDTADE
ncbi:MAG: hypothetical protein HYX68_10045 [Planctomycetes bacterium]|jgi:hypothetical protein|nr:hypothetical protein [Planctomycetota bacterium]